MPGTILLGYDIESASESTRGFLQAARVLHQRYGVPWTIYVTGRTVELRADDIKEAVVDPLVTLGQHTYDHMLLKSIYMTPCDGKPVHGGGLTCFKRGGELSEIRDQLTRTQDLIAETLGVECCGLTGPWAYYRGLVDRPDILQVLQDIGIRWIRTYGRDWRDCQPTPFTAQPFFYREHGFPEILELGMQGYQDDFYWDRFDDRRHGATYEDYLREMTAEIVRNDWTWNVCSHDHGTTTTAAFDAGKGKWLESLISGALEMGVRFISPETLYDELHNPSVQLGSRQAGTTNR